MVINHVTTKNQNLRRIDIGSLKSVKMVTNSGFKLILQSSIKSVIQNFEQNNSRTEFQIFQAHGANINIFVARHWTEFEFPTHLCPSQLITKCAHKNNSSTHQKNTTNATGQKWDRTAVAKQSATSNVTYSTLSKNARANLLRICPRRNSKRCLTTFSIENKPLYLSLNVYANEPSALQEMGNNWHRDSQNMTSITDCSKNLCFSSTCKMTYYWKLKNQWTHFVISTNSGRKT
jgi:hypothetical protein